MCRGIWRNGLLFGPYDKYGGYSYADVMTIPLAEAMRDALNIVAAEGNLATPHDRHRPVVYMGLQGERVLPARVLPPARGSAGHDRLRTVAQ